MLVEAITALPLSARPRALISASGSDYYPFAADTEFDDDEVTETDPPSESFLGRLCRDWEHEAQAATRAGLRVVCMRTGLVLGPGGALAKLTTPFKLFVGGKIGSGRQWVPWIHRADAVRSYLAAIDDDRYTGPINPGHRLGPQRRARRRARQGGRPPELAPRPRLRPPRRRGRVRRIPAPRPPRRPQAPP